MFKKSKEPTAKVVFELIKILKAKITFNSLKNILLQHPDFPFITSITNTLLYFGIKNKVVKIAPNQLNLLELPFLALSRYDELYMVKKIDDYFIEYYSQKNGWTKTKLKEFYKLWNNMVILVDTKSKLIEENFKKKKRLEHISDLKIAGVLILVITFVFFVFFSLEIGLTKMYFLIKLIGVFISLLLVKKLIFKDISYDFCTIGKKINCDDVLNSPAAKIFNWLTLADIGLIYFSGSTLALITPLFVADYIKVDIQTLLFLISFIAIPYTFFSVFYQGVVLKKWCILCVGVILVIWLELFIGYLYFSEYAFEFKYSFKSILLLIFNFIIPIILWSITKEILVKITNYDHLKNTYSRLVNHFNIFNTLQNKEKDVPFGIIKNEIILGNNDAKNTILIVMNPYCPSCGREYEHILSLLEKKPSYAKIIIRFIGYGDDRRYYTSLMLICQYLNSPNTFNIILKEWFKIKNVNQFVNKYPITHNKLAESIIQEQFLWCEKSNIDSTPTTFINDKKLNSNYSISKIEYLLSVNKL